MAKILVVDDDEALRRLLRIELSDTYEIVDSGEPDQGLAVALESKPDVILLDLRMPKYSGYELLQTFVSFSRTHTIPVIIVSGEAGGQTKEYCRQLGAAGYFEKPINIEALHTCLAQLAKPRQNTSQSEVHVPLQIFLKLRGTHSNGNEFEQTAITESASSSGFHCVCRAELLPNSVVDVYLTHPKLSYVGKAQAIRGSTKDGLPGRYNFHFVEKSGPWVIR
jgi:CheY-like chemotaxis protein